jgi:O-antigen ligase
LKPRDVWRGLVVVFYGGAVLNAILAVYYIATGTVQEERLGDLSTGGQRALTLTTALYLAGAFLLALLNLERNQGFKHRLLHLAICVLAGFGIVVSYGRGVFYALGVIILVLFLTRSGLRRATLLVLPIIVCAVIVGSLASHGGSGFLPELTKRITTTSDASVEWRRAANAAIWQQVQENPIVGVGFGQGASFVVGFARYDITQDPHDSYLFLWAGGGILTLASFLLLFAIFLLDSWRRYRNQADLPRTLIVWCVAFWFCIALNTISGPWLTQANVLLTFWILMLLPMTVPYARAAAESISSGGGVQPEAAVSGRPG